MGADDVLAVLDGLRDAGTHAVLDGGWGIDALLRRQTRPHADVDLVIGLDVLAVAERTLAALGLRRIDSRPGYPTRVVMDGPDGRRVDFHLVRFDEEGNGWQELPENDGSSAWFF